MKDVLAFIASAVALTLVVAGIGYASYTGYAFYAPRYAAVDNKVFHESAQYNDGMIRDLTELQRQYVTADAEGKAALKPIILHRFEVYPEDKMPGDLRDFYNSIK